MKVFAPVTLIPTPPVLVTVTVGPTVKPLTPVALTPTPPALVNVRPLTVSLSASVRSVPLELLITGFAPPAAGTRVSEPTVRPTDWPTSVWFAPSAAPPV